MAIPAFRDHFSPQAGEYEKYRPGYPPGLFEWLARSSPSRSIAVDVATGNGQAAIALASHFERVIGCEPSAAQLAAARAHARVEYRCEAAERISLPDRSVDLLTVAQAAHWFDWRAFCREAARVLKPSGVIAIWSYAHSVVTPAVDRVVMDFARDVVGPYWPRERRIVDDGYRDLTLPFAALAPPAFEMATEWEHATMRGYIGTWSAVQRYRSRTGRDPMALVAPALEHSWGAGARRVRWPLVFKAARA
jgi:SAM-dependent methyltransferase